MQKSKSNAAGIPDSSSSSCCCCIPPPMRTDPVYTSRILLVFLIVSLLLFVILAFFTVYFCRYVFIRRRNSDSSATASPGLGPQPLYAPDEDAAVGLDPSVVASFPTFTYSWVKNLHAGKYGLECAVCISEFQDDDAIRLLTPCSHVFHTECIDVWFMSHTTCPYCRHELNPAEEKSPEVMLVVAEEVDGREVLEEMREGEEEERLQQRPGEEGRDSRGPDDEVGRRSSDLKRLLRSNSTGHSSLGREDRFTLRLPKDVRERIARERNWTGSCIDFRYLFGDRDGAKEEDRQIGRSG